MEQNVLLFTIFSNMQKKVKGCVDIPDQNVGFTASQASYLLSIYQEKSHFSQMTSQRYILHSTGEDVIEFAYFCVGKVNTIGLYDKIELQLIAYFIFL